MRSFSLGNPAYTEIVEECAIPHDGLVLHYSAANRKSYKYPDMVWRNLIPIQIDGGFTNVTFNYDNGGNMIFSSGYISLGTPSVLTGLQVPASFCFWVYRTSSPTWATIYSQYSATSNHKLLSLVRVDRGQLVYYTSKSDGGIQGWSTGQYPSINTWYFIAMVVTGSLSSATVRAYIDKTWTGTYTFPSALSSTPDLTVPIYIGRTGPGEYWPGRIAEAMVYNRPLLTSEVYTIYDVQKERFRKL